MKYRKKAIIEAFQLGVEEHPVWFRVAMADGTVDYFWTEEPYCYINTRNGAVRADYKDYIIKYDDGRIYLCNPDIFNITYEKVEEQDDVL